MGSSEPLNILPPFLSLPLHAVKTMPLTTLDESTEWVECLKSAKRVDRKCSHHSHKMVAKRADGCVSLS